MVSKNQDVCARCHLAGLASGIDCTVASASDRDSQSLWLDCRTEPYKASIALGCNTERILCAVSIEIVLSRLKWPRRQSVILRQIGAPHHRKSTKSTAAR